MAPNRQKKKVKKLTSSLKKCRITQVEKTTQRGSVMSATADPQLVSKWPKLRMKVPPLFLHRTEGFQAFKENALDLAKSGIQFYYPRAVQFYIQFDFPSLDDHKAMAQYFDRKKLPYHTYGFPNKRKMKVMITGLPRDTELNIVKEDLKKLSIPVVRIHKLHTRDDSVRPLVIMLVVPHADDGKEIFKIKKILGHEVTLEPPKHKPRQCYRCQKWGHSQRYCHGTFKCVKCAGHHFYKNCTKKPETPPKCANCQGAHTANFKGCNYCPASEVYKRTKAAKKAINDVRTTEPQERKLLSTELLKDENPSIRVLNKQICLWGPPGEIPKCYPDEDLLCPYDSDDFYPSDVDEGDLLDM